MLNFFMGRTFCRACGAYFPLTQWIWFIIHVNEHSFIFQAHDDLSRVNIDEFYCSPDKILLKMKKKMKEDM
jgi:hypothetical protein